MRNENPEKLSFLSQRSSKILLFENRFNFGSRWFLQFMRAYNFSFNNGIDLKLSSENYGKTKIQKISFVWPAILNVKNYKKPVFAKLCCILDPRSLVKY